MTNKSTALVFEKEPLEKHITKVTGPGAVGFRCNRFELYYK